MAPTLRPSPSPSPEAWIAAPQGTYHAGEHWVHWCLEETLFGVTLWGRPGGPETERLVVSLRAELGAHVPPHRSLVDARFLEGADAQAFGVLGGYVTEHRERLSEKVTKLALVRPDGLPGAVTAGFFSTLQAPYPVEVFDGLDGALRWLECPDPVSASASLEELSTRARGTEPFVLKLRAFIGGNLSEISVERAAHALGVSERTFQRRLKQAGTTFQDELMACRVRESQRLLLDTDAPVTAIALDVGFSSSQHFSRTFQRIVGESPSAWRKRQRGQ